MPKTDRYQQVNDLIIQGLQNGVGPWTRPWRTNSSDQMNGSVPFNPVTGSCYSGANPWMLSITSSINGWTDPRFCTFKQMASKGWRIKDGQARSKGGPGPSLVYFWGTFTKEEEIDGQKVKKQVRFLKTYSVWNFEQLEGPDAWVTPEPTEAEPTEAKHTMAWDVCEAWPVHTSHGGGRAFYSPSADRIQLPKVEDFNSEEDYLSTRFHEMAHSTGHKTRLARDFSGRFGDQAYAFEELIAECTAANLMSACDVVASGTLRDDHVAYLESWIQCIRKDKYTIFSAFKQAKLAADAILDNSNQAALAAK